MTTMSRQQPATPDEPQDHGSRMREIVVWTAVAVVGVAGCHHGEGGGGRDGGGNGYPAPPAKNCVRHQRRSPLLDACRVS